MIEAAGGVIVSRLRRKLVPSSRLALGLAVALLGATSQAGAEAKQPAPAPRASFEPGLERLSELMGSLDFLSTLCSGSGWRGEMEKFLEAEQPDPARRQKFVAGFNRGYQTFAATYRTCTPSALAALSLQREEGAAITRDLGSRFGN